ncbi:M10 family metallopeptidase C-terminal domain-containing protein [Microvirga roseola]|uniref:M10 family metallopeptidase C-terminal domain-containing protein n=1 Tax=Microvirga roseola TaxID=2883126 RepID=UPI001E60F5E3|nr:M10 family metallopeptidase C-terminal domain-containing protein [Microvirga roseola]
MSYNTGWNVTQNGIDHGAQGGLGAFDIAALQALYGPNMSTATGDNTYVLPTFSDYVGEEGWFCIWDAGGQDMLDAGHALGPVALDLRAATRQSHDPNAGGFISWEVGVAGGFTIANGVVIENATGGSHSDELYGNFAANVLKGNSGQDRLWGDAGDDILYGGTGKDTLTGSSGRDAFVFDKKPSKKSNMDRISDFNRKDDTIRLDNAAFKKIGKAGKLKSKYFEAGSKADDRNDYIVYNKKKGILYYDADGSGKGKALEIASLKKKLKLTYEDFAVI